MSISTASPPRETRIDPRPLPARSALGAELGGGRIRLARYRRVHGTGRWRYRTLALPAASGATGSRARRRLRGELRAADLRASPLIAALASSAVDVFPVTLDPQDPSPRDLQVVQRSAEHLNYPLAEAVLDYAVLPEEVRRPGKENAAVLVFAAPRSLIDEWLAGLSAAGLQVDRLLTPACALAPHIGPGADGQRFLAVTTGEEATSVAVIQAQHVLLERLLPWGLARLAERLADELRLPADQCRALLAGAAPHDSAVQEILAPAMQELVREASSCLGYCDAFLQSVPAAGWILNGPLTRLAPLRATLEGELGLAPVGQALSSRLPALTGEGETAYATAAGCALWHEGGLQR